MAEIKNENYKFKSLELENIWLIFCGLAETTFSSVEMLFGKKFTHILSGQAMMSVCRTIETIDFCCYRNAYSDAYTLIRKFRDDLMQYLYLLNVIQNEHNLDNEGIEILAVEKWISNLLEKEENGFERSRFFGNAKYKQNINKSNEKCKSIFENFFEGKWFDIDRKLNNYVHANGIRFINDNYIYQSEKENKDRELLDTIQNITDIFLSLLSLLDSTKVRSSDYIDAIEMNLEPQEGSQYWVCPIILNYMNSRFHKELLLYIQDNERNGMRYLAEYYDA